MDANESSVSASESLHRMLGLDATEIKPEGAAFDPKVEHVHINNTGSDPPRVETHREQPRVGTGIWVLLGIGVLVIIFAAYVVKLAGQTGRLAAYNDANQKSIVLLNQNLTQQTKRIDNVQQIADQVKQSLAETNIRNGHIENRLSKIEDDHMGLKRANAVILKNEEGLKAQLDLIGAQLKANAAKTQSTPTQPLPQPQQPEQTSQASKGSLPSPPGALVEHDAKGEIWTVQRNGQEIKVRPVMDTRYGILVDCPDGKQRVIDSKTGKWWMGRDKYVE